MLGRRRGGGGGGQRHIANHRGVAPMTLPPAPDRWTIDLANAERMEAIAATALRGIRRAPILQLRRDRPWPEEHGLPQGARRAAIRDANHDGKLYRGRVFHVHYKPPWAASCCRVPAEF